MSEGEVDVIFRYHSSPDLVAICTYYSLTSLQLHERYVGLASSPYLISLLPFHLVLILSHIIDTLGHPIRHQTLIIHHLLPDRHGLAKRLPANHAIVPRLDVGELLQRLRVGDPEHHVHAVVPCDEGQIGVGALVPDQPLLPPQRLFQDAENPFHLVRVPLDGGRQLFGMEHVEPDRRA